MHSFQVYDPLNGGGRITGYCLHIDTPENRACIERTRQKDAEEAMAYVIV